MKQTPSDNICMDNYDPFTNIEERVIDQEKLSLRRRGRGCLFYKDFVERLLQFEESKFEETPENNEDIKLYKLKNVRQHTYTIMQSKMKKSIQQKEDFNLLGCWGLRKDLLNNMTM